MEENKIQQAAVVEQTDTDNVSNKFISEKEIYNQRRKKLWFINLLCKKEERLFANGLLRKYLKAFKNIRLDEFDLLKDLIYEEILKSRIQTKLNNVGVADISPSLLRSLHEIEGKIFTLKKRLGLDKDK